MKLSEKGKENLAGYGFAHNCDGAFSLLDDYEFDQDDFEGTICLTVEEAKMLEDMALRWMFLNPKNVTLKSAQLMKQLCQQIGQAERKE